MFSIGVLSSYVIDAYFLNANNNGKNCEIHYFLLSLPVELKDITRWQRKMVA